MIPLLDPFFLSIPANIGTLQNSFECTLSPRTGGGGDGREPVFRRGEDVEFANVCYFFASLNAAGETAE